jgi:hypothetical protein
LVSKLLREAFGVRRLAGALGRRMNILSHNRVDRSRLTVVGVSAATLHCGAKKKQSAGKPAHSKSFAG